MAATILGASNPDQDDFNRHVDYIHWNPVKHGVVKQANWHYSTFHRYIRAGIHLEHWGGELEFTDDSEFGE